MAKKITSFLFYFLLALSLFAQEAWLIPLDSPLYREAEELFINAGVVPPYEELPLAAEELKSQLLGLVAGTEETEDLMAIYDLNDAIRLPFGNIAPILELGLRSEEHTSELQ